MEAPYAVQVTDPVQFAADVTFCTTAAQGAPSRFSLGNIATGAIRGGAANAPAAAASPLVPAIGAAAGATSSLMDALDVANAHSRAVFIECLDKKTERDRSALVLEPSQ
jgi:hypothetical protein